MMNRRRFTQCLAAGAGTLALPAATGQTTAPASPVGRDDASPPLTASVADFEAIAKTKLPPATFDYIKSGSGDQITLRENVEAFGRLKLLPPVMAGVDQVDLTTTVLKQKVAMPILLAPVGGQRIFHPDGAMAAARAAARAGTVYGTSSSTLNTLEDVAAANGDGLRWYQLYVPKDRAIAESLVRRAEAAGYGAIIVTVDLGERKDADLRNRFSVSREILHEYLLNLGFTIDPQISFEDLRKYNATLWDRALSWEFFGWLRERTKLPLLVKGVLRRDDALRAVEVGVDGIIVSNHGGRRLDTVPATIDRLPEIVEAVDGRAEVLLDSGVRRGTDVLKAIALGARAVLIGRAYAWALAADGEAGVSRILQLLREEFAVAMHACGCRTVGDIHRGLVLR